MGWFFVLPIFSSTATKMLEHYSIPKKRRHREILMQWIKEKKGQSDKSYIDMMLESGIDPQAAVSDVISIFQAGVHTTAESVQLMLYTMAKYPDVQQKIYLELREIFGNADDINIVDTKSLNKAHYLRAFIEETLRLKSGRGVPRQLLDDFRVDFEDKNGKKDYYVIPKGCNIVFNTAYLMRDDEIGWQNGMEWNVENYLDESGLFVKSKKYFDKRFKMTTFGNGRRNCPGISLARKEIMFAVSILVYKYEFCGPKGKGDTDFVIPTGLLSGGRSKELEITVIKR